MWPFRKREVRGCFGWFVEAIKDFRDFCIPGHQLPVFGNVDRSELRMEIIDLSVWNCAWQAVYSSRWEWGGAAEVFQAWCGAFQHSCAAVRFGVTSVRLAYARVASVRKTGQLFSLGSTPAADTELTEQINLRWLGAEAGLQSEPRHIAFAELLGI